VPVPFARTTRSLARDTPAAAVFAWAFAALLLAAWSYWFVSGQVTLYQASQHARLEVRQAAHPVTALLPGRVTANRLRIGQEVLAGEVLVELDAARERLALDEERARLAALDRQLAAITQEIAARTTAGGDDRLTSQAAVRGARLRGDAAAAEAAFAADNERRLRDDRKSVV